MSFSSLRDTCVFFYFNLSVVSRFDRYHSMPFRDLFTVEFICMYSVHRLSHFWTADCRYKRSRPLLQKLYSVYVNNQKQTFIFYVLVLVNREGKKGKNRDMTPPFCEHVRENFPVDRWQEKKIRQPHHT